MSENNRPTKEWLEKVNYDVFSPEKLKTFYLNTRLAHDSSDETIHFYVQNERGNDVAEVFYIPTSRYWRVIKDNFPLQRQGYSFDLPISIFGQLEYYFASMKITLVRAQEKSASHE